MAQLSTTAAAEACSLRHGTVPIVKQPQLTSNSCQSRLFIFIFVDINFGMDAPASTESHPKKRPKASKKPQSSSKGESTKDRAPKFQSARSVFNAFQKHGAQNTEEIEKTLQKLVSPDALAKYVNEFATMSEENVLDKMKNSPEFVQCASWSEILDSVGFRETCNNELPLALQIIAHTEHFPKPENANGVDFQLLYLNLASMMMGQPIRVMNQSTQDALKKVYEETVLQTSRADQKEEIAILHETLKTMRNPVQSNEQNRIVDDLRRLFADPNINPFRLPINQICSNNP
ncbi:uncharacterized protein LOC120898372 [Anopheles arabiensis]|nr:uncharacterized protein LOC120898372 [Anopheles arabiensis]